MKMKMAFILKMSKKSFKDYFLKMSLNLEIMDQTMPMIIHVSWRKLLGARVAMVRYQQELWRKFTSTEQM